VNEQRNVRAPGGVSNTRVGRTLSWARRSGSL